MITITRNNRELYIGIDYPTPRPEIPIVGDGQIITLYEYTFQGPKYVGKYMAKENQDGMIEIGPLKILPYSGLYAEIHYKGYHQWLEFKSHSKCFDCTHYEEYIESIQRCLFTDSHDFFVSIIGDASTIFEGGPRDRTLLSTYNYVSYVDGVLVAGSRIRKIDGTTIKPVIENGKIYYLELDENHIPPREVNRTEVFTLPFRIKNGTIKHFRVTNYHVQLEIQYPDFKTSVRVDPLTGEVKKVSILHDKKLEEIIPELHGIDPQTLALLMEVIDEKGIDALKIIKEMGDLP